MIDVHITIRGEIDGRLSQVFDGLRLDRRSGLTVVTGWLADESQVHGLLGTIQNFGLRIASAHWNDITREERR